MQWLLILPLLVKLKTLSCQINRREEKDMYLSETYQKKWQPVLDHPDLPKISDSYKRAVTSVILENQENALKEDRAFLKEDAPVNQTGSNIDNWDPILISLVRRAMPNLIAYDICLLYTSPSPRDRLLSRMPSSA